MEPRIPRRGPLIVLDRYAGPQAGTERQILELVDGLIERGWQPGFLTLHRSAWLEQRFPEAPSFDVGSSQLKSPALWRRAWQGAAWAQGQGYRVAHVFFNDSALVFPGPLHRHGIRVVQARRDLGFWYTPFKLRLLRLNRRWTRAVVGNSRAVVDAIGAAEGYATPALHVIYNGLRLPQADAGEAQAIRHSLGIGTQDQLVVKVANLRPLKRPQDAIEAIARLQDAGRPAAVHLALVGGDNDGSGAQRVDLIRLAEARGVRDRVHFPGQVPSAAPWIAAADVCVLCSESEGLSNAVIEYMLAARAVVVSAAGGNPELIDDGRTGFVVPIGDVAALTDRLRQLLDDPPLAARLGAAAQAHARTNFSVESMVSRHEALYASLAA